MYEKLYGGYLDPRYSMEDSEDWTYVVGMGVTSTASLGNSPRVHGTRSLGFYLTGSETVTASSPMRAEFTEATGVGLLTYATDDTTTVGATLRLYTNLESSTRPAWFEFSWIPSAPEGGGFYRYGDLGTTYGTALYGFDQNIEFGDWAIVVIPKESFEVHGTPNWSEITEVSLEITSDDPIEVFVDGISAWTELDGASCAANQFIWRLPEYHHDQDFNDSLATAAGYALDALTSSLTDLAPAAVSARNVETWEAALDIPSGSVGLSVEERRNVVLAVLSRAQSPAEFEAALSLGVGVPVRVVENYAAYSLAVYAPISSSDEARVKRLQMICDRLRPAHLGVTYHFPTASVGANGQLTSNLVAGQWLSPTLITGQEDATLADANAIVT